MLNGKMSLRSHRVPGGLYFGPPAWDAPLWPAVDPIAATPPADAPQSATQLCELAHRLNFSRNDIWTPSLSEQLRIAGEEARYIILNLIPPQPESIMSSLLSEFELPRMVAALQRVCQCFPAAQARVAIARNEYNLRYQWRASAKKNKWRIRPLVNRYPQGHPTILLRALLGLKLQPGESPARHGVILLDPITCWTLGYWLDTGRCPDWHPIEVFTHNMRPCVIAAPLGQPLAKILTDAGIHCDSRQCIINGMMAGKLVDPAATVLEPWMQMISLRPPPALEMAVDCIRCGWCVNACPSGLNPAGLMAQVRIMDCLSAVAAHEADACIECGLCSYVCPSRLPLAVTIRGMKHTNQDSALVSGGRS